MNIHAGGIVWAGPYLHIAATSRGFVTARVDDIMRVPGDDDHPEKLGIEGTHARTPSATATCCRSASPTRPSPTRATRSCATPSCRWTGAPSPPALVAGEYGLAPDATTRLARYPLDPETWQLATGDDGFSRPLALDDGGVRQMQGAVIAGGRFHVTVSHGPWMPGTRVRRRARLDAGSTAGRCRWVRRTSAYWPSTDRIWSVTEHPRRRWIVRDGPHAGSTDAWPSAARRHRQLAALGDQAAGGVPDLAVLLEHAAGDVAGAVRDLEPARRRARRARGRSAPASAPSRAGRGRR